MPVTEAYELSRGVLQRAARRWTAGRVVAPLGLETRGFVLSVCFDDAPVSAVTRGAGIMAEAGARATYYIATGLLGQDGVSGRIAGAADVRRLAEGGHEVALHGHGHEDMSRMSPEAALDDIARNRAELAEILGEAPSGHFAYPFGATSVPVKKTLADKVLTARGVLAGINGPQGDRVQLSAYDLRPEAGRSARAEAAMCRAAKAGGWVILFTHDVAAEPSAYGVTPEALTGLLGRARALGAEILPVGVAWERMLTGRTEARPVP